MTFETLFFIRKKRKKKKKKERKISFQKLAVGVSPFARKHCDGSRFVQTVVDQDFAARSVQTSHFDGVASGVGPVHVPGHPVHSQPVCGLQALADHSLHAAAVQVCTSSEENKRAFKEHALSTSHSINDSSVFADLITSRVTSV